MRTPLIFTAVAVALAWIFVGMGQPLLAAVVLFFCLFGLASWFFASPGQAFGALLTLAVFSPPGVAFALGLTDGFFGDRVEAAEDRARVPGDALLELPYTAGVEVFGGADLAVDDVG